MTQLGLQTRDRRALRLGAWILVPALTVTFVIQPYREALRVASGKLITERSLLVHELGAIREAPRDSELVRRGRQAVAIADARLFDGADAIGVSALLAAYVADVAARTGVRIDASETRVALDSATPAAVDISASGNILAIVRFLRALEDGPKLTRVDRIALAPPLNVLGPRRNRELTLSATIVGFPRRDFGDPLPTRASLGGGP